MLAVATAVGLLVLPIGLGAAPIAVAESPGSIDSTDESGSGTTTANAGSSSATALNSTRLSGTVTDENGDPILRATVSAAGGPETTTNSDGFYSLELEPGDHEITVSADGFESETWNESLSAGEWAGTDVTLSIAPIVLEGTVANESDAAIENATVRVLGTGNETTTDEDGAFAFELEPGEYTLETNADGHVKRQSIVTLEVETRPATKNVTLREVNGTDGDDAEDAESGDETDAESGTENEGGTEAEDEGGTEAAKEGGTEAEDETADTDATDAEPERDSDTSPTIFDQVATMLFFAGTFLAALIAATTVGLYRDRVQ